VATDLQLMLTRSKLVRVGIHSHYSRRKPGCCGSTNAYINSD